MRLPTPIPPVAQAGQYHQPAQAPLLILPVPRRLLAFSFVFGQFSLFPAAATFGADAVEEFASRFDVWMRGAPVGGQVTAEDSGQH